MIEKVEFFNGKDCLKYTISEILEDDEFFLIFLDKFGLKQTLAKRFISRRWTE